MSELCSTCLSQDRNLFTLDKDKYAAIFGHQIIIDSVCWECLTMFQKLHKFKLQVLRAQKLFHRRTLVALTPLTHLTFSKINIFDVCCNQNGHIKDEEPESETAETDLPSEIKTEENDFEIEIKTENDFEDDTSNSVTDDEIDNIQCDKTIPIENIDVIKHDHDNETVTENTKNNKQKVIKEKKNNYNETVTEYTKNNKQKVIKEKKKLDKRKTIDRIDNKTTPRKYIVRKDNYIMTEMTEDEMLEKRDRDREADRYKNQVKFRCDSCIVGYFQKDVYEKHMKTRHLESAGRHVCMICKTRFTKINYYKDHIESHYKKYQCKSCSYVGYKLTEMVSHDAREHNVLRFICKVCHVEFPSPSSLRFHRESKHEDPLKCELCSKFFNNKNSLRVHTQQKHAFMPKIPCTVCGTRVRYMKIHMRKHDAVPEAAYCTECDKKFTSTASYKMHLKFAAPHRSPDVLKHACRSCDAKFINSTRLRLHEQASHSHVRPFKCDRCGKGFDAKFRLKQHIRHDHEGVEKPKNNVCHICGKGFNAKHILSNHIRVHTGEKPFKCDLCSAVFTQKSTLTTHMRGVHLKIKQRSGRASRA